MVESSTSFAKDTAPAEERRESFVGSLSQELLDREDRVASTLRQLNASPKSKLRRIYVLMDEISQARSNYVACSNGCADCCRINITITKLEASQLSQASGRTAADVVQSKEHLINEFWGNPCPFLVNDSCSVYDDRPLACRMHASYYINASACKSESTEDQGFPLVVFNGLKEALHTVAMEKQGSVFADIRDFFPVVEVAVRQ